MTKSAKITRLIAFFSTLALTTVLTASAASVGAGFGILYGGVIVSVVILHL